MLTLRNLKRLIESFFQTAGFDWKRSSLKHHFSLINLHLNFPRELSTIFLNVVKEFFLQKIRSMKMQLPLIILY